MRAPIWSPASHRPRAASQRSRRLAALALLPAGALLAASLAACASSSGSSSSGKNSPYTIHAILSLTGAAAFLGTEQKASLVALAKQVNATGGIHGHPLKFAFSDNQSTPSTAVSLASPMLSKVPVLIVGSITATDRPVDDLVTSDGPLIYDLSPGDHPARGSLVYSAGNSTVSQTQAFINFAQAKGWKRLAAITSTDTSGQDGWENIQHAVAASKGGVSIISHETFGPTDVSVTTQLSKIKASKPQGLLIWTTGTPLGTVLKGMQQLGMGSMPTMTTNGNASAPEMQRLSGDLPAQLYFPGAPFEVGPHGLSGAEKSAVQAFDNAMTKAGEKVPGEGNALSWDPGIMLVGALKKLGTGASAQQLHHYISSLSNFAGINGAYNFTSSAIPDNRGVGLPSVYVVRWDQSKGHWLPASGPAGKGAP